MDQDRTKDVCEQFKIRIRETWDILTDDDIALVNSDRDEFFFKLHRMYGLNREGAQQRLAKLEQACNEASPVA